MQIQPHQNYCSIELSGVVHGDDGDMYVDNISPELFGVYLRKQDGEAVWEADFAAYSAAREYAERGSSISGLPIDDNYRRMQERLTSTGRLRPQYTPPIHTINPTQEAAKVINTFLKFK